MEDVEKWDLRSQKASKKGKYDWGNEKKVFHFRRLFNQGSEEFLELSERKVGVGFVDIKNERNMRKLK